MLGQAGQQVGVERDRGRKLAEQFFQPAGIAVLLHRGKVAVQRNLHAGRRHRQPVILVAALHLVTEQHGRKGFGKFRLIAVGAHGGQAAWQVAPGGKPRLQDCLGVCIHIGADRAEPARRRHRAIAVDRARRQRIFRHPRAPGDGINAAELARRAGYDIERAELVIAADLLIEAEQAAQRVLIQPAFAQQRRLRGLQPEADKVVQALKPEGIALFLRKRGPGIVVGPGRAGFDERRNVLKRRNAVETSGRAMHKRHAEPRRQQRHTAVLLHIAFGHKRVERAGIHGIRKVGQQPARDEIVGVCLVQNQHVGAFAGQQFGVQGAQRVVPGQRRVLAQRDLVVHRAFGVFAGEGLDCGAHRRVFVQAPYLDRFGRGGKRLVKAVAVKPRLPGVVQQHDQVAAVGRDAEPHDVVALKREGRPRPFDHLLGQAAARGLAVDAGRIGIAHCAVRRKRDRAAVGACKKTGLRRRQRAVGIHPQKVAGRVCDIEEGRAVRIGGRQHGLHAADAGAGNHPGVAHGGQCDPGRDLPGFEVVEQKVAGQRAGLDGGRGHGQRVLADKGRGGDGVQPFNLARQRQLGQRPVRRGEPGAGLALFGRAAGKGIEHAGPVAPHRADAEDAAGLGRPVERFGLPGHAVIGRSQPGDFGRVGRFVPPVGDQAAVVKPGGRVGQVEVLRQGVDRAFDPPSLRYGVGRGGGGFGRAGCRSRRGAAGFAARTAGEREGHRPGQQGGYKREFRFHGIPPS